MPGTGAPGSGNWMASIFAISNRIECSYRLHPTHGLAYQQEQKTHFSYSSSMSGHVSYHNHQQEQQNPREVFTEERVRRYRHPLNQSLHNIVHGSNYCHNCK